MKNNSGFSLVELIVVIAIMAILAGVAVPTYTKYVENAKDAKVLSQLDELKTAAFAAAALEGEEVTSIVVTSAGAITVNTNGTDANAGTTGYTDYLKEGWTISFNGTSSSPSSPG